MLGAFGLYLLAVCRIIGFLASVPLFSHPLIPSRVKGGLALILGFLFAPLTKGPDMMTLPLFHFALLIAGEIALGLCFGFVTILVLGIARVGGEVMGFLVGFSFVNVLDPTSNQEVSILGEFYHEMALLFFILFKGPFVLVGVLKKSFILLPLGFSGFEGVFLQYFFQLFREFFNLGIQFSLPVMGALLLTETSLGLVAKAVPQMNIFQVGFPLKIGVGLILFVFTVPVVEEFFGVLMGPYLKNIYLQLFEILKGSGG